MEIKQSDHALKNLGMLENTQNVFKPQTAPSQHALHQNSGRDLAPLKLLLFKVSTVSMTTVPPPHIDYNFSKCVLL